MKIARVRIPVVRRIAALTTVALVGAVLPLVTGSQPAEAARATRTIHLTAGANLELPLYVTSITVQAVGGAGRDGRDFGSGAGGKGGTTWANLAVTPGETLQIVVGNSGTTGAPADALSQRFAGGSPVTYLLGKEPTGAGGSASVVLRNGQPLVVAAGGGGGGNAFCEDPWCGGGKGGDGGGFAGLDGSGASTTFNEGIGGTGTTDTSRGQDAVASKEPSGIFNSTGGESGGGGGGWRGGKAGTIGTLGSGGGGGAGGTSMSVDPGAKFGPAGTAGDGWVNITYNAPFLATNGEISTAVNPSQFGDNVIFNVAMAWSASAGIGTPGPTGQITFGTKDLKTGIEAAIGMRNVAANGSASFALPTTLPVGTTLVWAYYPGDDNHSAFKTNYYAQSVIAGRPSFSLSPAVLDFGAQPVGSTTYQTVTLTNTGSATWQALGGRSDGTAFAIQSTDCQSPIAPSASCKLTAKFTPASEATVSANIILVDGIGNETVIPMRGTGVAAVMNAELKPSVLTFGNVPVGTTTTAVVTLTSVGNVAFRLAGVLTSNAAFNQAATSCRVGVDITSCTFTFSYKASQAGPEGGRFDIFDTQGHGYVVEVSGTGVAMTTTTVPVQPTTTTIPATTTTTTTTVRPTTTIPATTTTTTTIPATTTTTTTIPATTTTTIPSPPLPPTITGVSPATGRRRGGTTVTITGRNLTSVSAIVFGTSAAQQFSCPTSTRCTAVSPSGRGSVHISLRPSTASTPPSPVDQFRYTGGGRGDNARDDGRDEGSDGHRGDDNRNGRSDG